MRKYVLVILVFLGLIWGQVSKAAAQVVGGGGIGVGVGVGTGLSISVLNVKGFEITRRGAKNEIVYAIPYFCGTVPPSATDPQIPGTMPPRAAPGTYLTLITFFNPSLDQNVGTVVRVSEAGEVARLLGVGALPSKTSESNKCDDWIPGFKASDPLSFGYFIVNTDREYIVTVTHTAKNVDTNVVERTGTGDGGDTD